jgi:hypothetical protein
VECSDTWLTDNLGCRHDASLDGGSSAWKEAVFPSHEHHADIEKLNQSGLRGA